MITLCPALKRWDIFSIDPPKIDNGAASGGKPSDLDGSGWDHDLGGVLLASREASQSIPRRLATIGKEV